MRVLHLPSSYLPDALGGTEVYVQNLIHALNPLGVESRVAIHGRSDTQNLDKLSDPAELIRLPSLPRHTRRQLYVHSSGKLPTGFLETLQCWRPDVVNFHAFTLGAGVDHAALLNAYNIPYVITYHTPAQSCARGSLMRNGHEPCNGVIIERRCAACLLQSRGVPVWLQRIASRSCVPANLPDGPWVPLVALPALLRDAHINWLSFYSGAKAIVATAEFIKPMLLANGIKGDKIQVLRQALPGSNRKRSLRKVRDSDTLKLGFFGRVTHLKGVDLACKAFSILQKKGCRGQLEIAGPVDAKSEEWLYRLLDASNARYLGVLRGDKLTEWLRAIDLLLVPSRCLETGPLTLLEAWDEGTPAVGSNLGGIREFFNEMALGNYLFESESVEDLVVAIERFQDQFDNRCSVRIRGFDELGAQYATLYRKVTCQASNC